MFLFACWAFRRRFNSSKVFSTFSLSHIFYTLTSSDLGGSKASREYLLSNHTCVGMPDAEFRKKRYLKFFPINNYVVGEYKNRYFRGVVRYREYYQVMLYIGLAGEKYNTTSVYGLLAFKDKVIKINFDKKLYNSLLSLKSEYYEVKDRWNGSQFIALHERSGVKLRCNGFRFSDN
jgi:hypothetical protein